jgi:serine/threonine protein kinase
VPLAAGELRGDVGGWTGQPIAGRQGQPLFRAAQQHATAAVRAKSAADQHDFEVGLDSFLEEARLITRFRHPNIVHVRRFFEMHETGYIVLDYERGQTLGKRLEHGPLPEDELRATLFGLLDGLEAIHTRAILHRDLKPSNVILREDGSPVLIDFGAARDFKERHSRSITAIAAPGYSPPEQYAAANRGRGPTSMRSAPLRTAAWPERRRRIRCGVCERILWFPR